MIRAIRENLSPTKMMIDGELHVATKINYYYMKSSCVAFTHRDANAQCGSMCLLTKIINT